MPVAEILVTSVAPAIAKSVLKRWLKDGTALNVGTALVDVAKQRFTDAFSARRAERQFTAIGERVAESLQPLFESESDRLEEGEAAVVARGLAHTLEQATISAGLLAEKDLDASRLAAHLLDADPSASRLLSQQGKDLYERMVRECSARIVDIAAELPLFTERTVAEILKRETELLGIAERILREAVRIRDISEQANPERRARQFEEDYRRAVLRRLDRLELFGADLSEASRRHRLSVAYVVLSVRRQAKPENGEAPENASEMVPAHEALAGARCLLVRGPAGSGKTTLLQWAAVRSAARDFPEEMADWNETVPFFVRLRDFAHGDLPRPEAFPGLVASAVAAEMPEPWVQEQLHAGRGLVLVDGVDEIPASRRDAVRAWLEDLVGSFEDSRFFVTSRPTLEEGWLASLGFSEAELQPMGMGSIRSFVEHWHDAVREALPDEEERQHLPALAAGLIGTVEQRREIRNLAQTPLLCAMLCAIHRERRQEVPRSRLALYRACCDMLISRRDQERRILADPEYPPLDPEQRLLVLQDLAWWMARNGYWTTVPVEQARAHIEPLVGRLAIGTRTDSEGVLRLLVDRTGIVREPTKGEMDFAHRTFQEYLAALAALASDDIGLLLRNAGDDQWREMIILAAGLAAGDRGEGIVRDLIRQGDKDRRVATTRHLLAVACLETMPLLSPETQDLVRARLRRIMPPRTPEAADAVARAGELALPYLAVREVEWDRGSHPRDTGMARACVRALGGIGGEGALALLEEWAQDAGSAITEEAVTAWDQFDDRAEYARRVLAKAFRDADEAKFQGLPSLDGIQHLTGISRLHIQGSSAVTDLTPLAGLTALTSLDLEGCDEVTDLAPLAGLTALTSLHLQRCDNVTDLTPLAGLTALTLLHLQGCDNVTDLTPLTGLVALTSLRIWGCRKVTDLAPLAGLIGLTSLHLWNCDSTDLAPLAGLIGLTSLDLWRCHKVADVSPLAGLTGLTMLDLSGSHVTDLTPLGGLMALANLVLKRCREITELAPLTGLTALTSLDLGECWKVTDLAPLAGLSSLTWLSLDGCPAASRLGPLDARIRDGSLHVGGVPLAARALRLVGLGRGA